MTGDNGQHEQAVRQALEEVRSENPRVRSAAVERLGKLQAGLPALQIATTDRNGYVRAAAAEALAHFSGEEVALFLGDLLFDSNPFVRSAAIRSLGKVDVADYIPNLVDTLDDSNPHIRAAALRALSDLNAPQAAKKLTEALRDAHRKVRLDAARGLRHLADPTTHGAMREALQEGLREPRPDLPFLNTLIQAIAASASVEEVGPLLVKLMQEAVGCRTVAARAIRPLKYEPARPTLERALTDRNPNLRLAAIHALEEVGVGPSLPAVRELLEDENNRVQRSACRALTRAGDEEVIPTLREMAYSPNPFQRPRAIKGLATLDPEDSRELFLDLLTDNNIEVRRATMDALAPYHHEEEVRAALEQAREIEVTEQLRERLENLLAGEPTHVER